MVEVSQHGIGNISAGGNVQIFAASGLAAYLGSLNRLVGAAISSVEKPGHNEPFDSESMMLSLCGIGVPPTKALEVVQDVVGTIAPIRERPLSISASDLRREVKDAILRCQDEANRQLEWAERYVRRHGDPDHRLTVIDSDGHESTLSYDFVYETVLPTVGIQITDIPWDTLKKMIVKRPQMARELVNQLRALDLHTVDLALLIEIATSIAARPPHPWFIQEATRDHMIHMNLERSRLLADRSLERDIDQIPERDRGQHLYDLVDCVQHLCASLLSYYGQVLGSGTMSAAQHLRRLLEALAAGDPVFTWTQNRLQDLEPDMALANVGNPADLHGLLKRLMAITLTVRNLPALRAFHTATAELRDLVESVVGARHRLEETARTALARGSIVGEEHLLATCIGSAPGIAVGELWEDGVTASAIHELDVVPFDQMTKKIMVRMVLDGQVESDFTRALNEVLETRNVKLRYADTIVLVVSNASIGQAELAADDAMNANRQIRVVPVAAENLLRIPLSKRRVESLVSAMGSS